MICIFVCVHRYAILMIWILYLMITFYDFLVITFRHINKSTRTKVSNHMAITLNVFTYTIDFFRSGFERGSTNFIVRAWNRYWIQILNTGSRPHPTHTLKVVEIKWFRAQITGTAKGKKCCSLHVCGDHKTVKNQNKYRNLKQNR